MFDAGAAQVAMHGYVHEAIAGVVLSVGGWIMIFPVRTFFTNVRDRWEAQTKILGEIQVELGIQRNNCLNTLSVQGVEQIKLLEKTVETLEAMHLDQRTLLGRLDK